MPGLFVFWSRYYSIVYIQWCSGVVAIIPDSLSWASKIKLLAHISHGYRNRSNPSWSFYCVQMTVLVIVR